MNDVIKLRKARAAQNGERSGRARRDEQLAGAAGQARQGSEELQDAVKRQIPEP